MNVTRRRYARDNYTYLLTEGSEAAIVDPGDAPTALALAQEHGIRPRWILHTHGHADHTGGTAEVARALGAEVLGSGADAHLYAARIDVRGRGELVLGALRVRVHEVPGHTPGSVAYEAAGALFTCDTLFWGGAGNCKSGDPRQLAQSFLGVIARLPDALVVHPGHDYAEANLPFALDLEPENGDAAAQLAAARAAHARGTEPAPTTLGEERRSNPFLRAGLLRDALAARGRQCEDEEGAFVAIRALKDRWRP